MAAFGTGATVPPLGTTGLDATRYPRLEPLGHLAYHQRPFVASRLEGRPGVPTGLLLFDQPRVIGIRGGLAFSSPAGLMSTTVRVGIVIRHQRIDDPELLIGDHKE